MTKRTYKELEQNKDGWKLLFVAMTLLCAFTIIISQTTIDKQRNELTECQEEVEVWILEANCYSIYMNAKVNQSIITAFDNYEDYERNLNYMLKDKDCEVIE